MYDPEKPYKKQILELIKETWETPYVSIKEGAYPIVKKKFSFPEFAHSDGIGTKGIYHWQKRTFKDAVLDALAMNLNDLLIIGVKPYAILNHLFLPKDDKKAILEIIGRLSKECKKRKIAILGGETAIHNDMKGIELSITMFGFIEKPRVNKLKIGDVLIGIASNGLHSNGFTKVREIFGNKIKAEFVAPTFIYFDKIFPLLKKFDIHAMSHITGGAFTKLKDILKNTDAKIKKNHKLKPQPIFYEIYKKGVNDAKMYKIFNCGIGFILFVKPKDANKVLSAIKNFKADIVGKITPGNGKIKIESSFSNKEIIL